MTTVALAPGVRRMYRLDAVDMLRGLVVVVMALDHVRDFMVMNATLDPLGDPNVTGSMFFTRWITHFCAPVFVTLAGTSAGLMMARKSPAELGRFLLTRGLWLVVVELVIISTAWTFSPGGIAAIGDRIMIPLQVIWAIGVSMIALSGFQFFGRRVCLWLGIAIIAAHNLLDPVWPSTQLLDVQWPLWTALHGQMSIPGGPFLFVNVYPVPAWVGVMLFGFGISPIFEMPEARRNALLLRLGFAITIAFVVLRALDVYGDPNHWQAQPRGATATVIDFLNTTKYPPSLLFLMMTLGPSAIVCALAGRAPEALRKPLVTFGRVPFAFYVAHLYLIHALTVLLGIAQGFRAPEMCTLFAFLPKGYGLSLPGVYLAWALVVASLYPLCRWVAAVKSRRGAWWLSYV
jgi:uncharacterized membrane protein